MTIGTQLYLLLWKNFTYRRRNKVFPTTAHSHAYWTVCLKCNICYNIAVIFLYRSNWSLNSSGRSFSSSSSLRSVNHTRRISRASVSDFSCVFIPSWQVAGQLNRLAAVKIRTLLSLGDIVFTKWWPFWKLALIKITDTNCCLIETVFVFLMLQVTFQTRHFRRPARWHGFRASSAISTTLAFITQRLERRPAEWATSTTPCESSHCNLKQCIVMFAFWSQCLMKMYSLVHRLSRLLVDLRTVLSISGNRTAFSGLQDLSLAVQRLGERPDAWPSMTYNGCLVQLIK